MDQSNDINESIVEPTTKLIESNANEFVPMLSTDLQLDLQFAQQSKLDPDVVCRWRSILLEDRESIVNELDQMYNYEFLTKLYDSIDDNILYKLLTGKNTKYDKSSIDWLPSKELVDSLMTLVTKFNIGYVEEIYGGLGILSALMTNASIKVNASIKITTSDPCINKKTCNQLGLIPIAKRSPSDFKYYDQLNEEYPQMIISSFYPKKKYDKDIHNIFVNEITKLIYSAKHLIVAVILPTTFVEVYELFYHIQLRSTYKLYSFNIKAVDKYFHLHKLMNNLYSSSMMIHIFVQKQILMDNDIKSIMHQAIIPSDYIDTYCSLARDLRIIYPAVSFKLIKCIYRNFDFTKTIESNDEFNLTMKLYKYLVRSKYKNIPQYIYEINEFILWGRCVTNKIYLIFADRTKFYEFYTTILRATSANNDSNDLDLPHWVNTKLLTYQYIYLVTICADNPTVWKANSKNFYSTFNRINNANLKILKGK